MILFEKTYNGETIYDYYRDVSEAIDGDYNPLVNTIPQDEHGFQKGKFKVLITWEE